MLTIINKDTLKGKDVTKGMITYYVEGIYEYPNTYNIHLRSYDKKIVDELLILLRDKKEENHNGKVWKYYDMYDNDRPEYRVGFTKEAVKNKGSVLKGIQSILEKN